MRKYLLGTTALVAASAVATSAMAMPIQSKSESGVPILTVSMVAQFEGGIASNDNNASSGNTRDGGFVNGRFAEIYFDGVLTADNGLVYGAKIHYKTGNGDGTATTGYPGREYIYMKGGWGSLELGNWIAADSGMNLCVTCNTYAGFGALDTPWKSYVIRPTGTWEGGATGGGGSTNNLWFDQSPRVTYYMPVVGGLQAGVSYTPSVDQFTQTSNQADNNKQKDFLSAGVQFNHEVDGVGIALSLVGGGSDGFLSNTTGTLGLNRIKDTTGIGYYELGARVKYAGFQFGGSWWDSGTGGAIKGRDYGWEAEGWSLEAAYFNGPYSMEVQYSQSAASSSRRVIT
ncbi:MAG: porin, partial [Alphaproteobacteria bacterium]